MTATHRVLGARRGQRLELSKKAGVFFLTLAVFLIGVGRVWAAAEIKNADCLMCHEDKTLAKTNAVGQVFPLFVDATKLSRSVHATNLCVNCHSDLTDKHPDDNVAAKPANCAGCHTQQPAHEKAVQEYATSVHGMSRKTGASGAARCSDCHGKHDMAAVKNSDSPVFKLNLPATCSKCHTNAALAKEYKMKYPQAAAQYADSIHGHALLKLGLVAAPSCNDCHGVHDIRRSEDHNASIYRSNLAKTCGKCHPSCEKTYSESIHGQMLAKGDSRAPVCIDCHSAHAIESPSGAHFKATNDERCGGCHKDRLEHYRETYHGKAMALGSPSVATEVASCCDCHGHHDVLPASNPKSSLSKANIIGTCAKCHPGANASFVKYVPHANPMDKSCYPQFYWVFMGMTGLLVGVFTFFGLHTLAWLARSGWLYLRDPKKFNEIKASTQKGDEWFTRFTPYQRLLHIMVVTSFLLLVITGMPLKFYYTDWAKGFFGVMGGAAVARALHRFGAIVTFLYFGLHLAALAVNTWRQRHLFKNPATGRYGLKQTAAYWLGPDSLVPTLQDWKDFVAHQKWFFGKGPRPQFDRWTYWEKFDYFAVFWGVFIIGFSGLIMWFPQFFTRFMPGWMINVALIVHSDEALLAAGFIFTVHFFNTHFRPEKFPMDTVIFSGRVSKAEMLHERKHWHERLLASGKLDQHRIRDEWARWKGIARAFGYLFFGTGLVLLALIIYAMISHLIRGW